MSHSEASKESLVTAAMAMEIEPADLKARCRIQFGCSIGELTDTFDPLELPAIRSLLAAIDAGDDEVLPILADALEEDGDGRAAGLRHKWSRRLTPAPQNARPENWGWKRIKTSGACVRPHHVETGIWERLQGATIRGGQWKWWPTRSGAFLALAAALT